MAVAEQLGIRAKTILYMKKDERPDRATLARLVDMLEDPPEDLVRKDARFKALGLDPQDYVANKAAVVDLLAEHGELMQRPVLTRSGYAIIGRPKGRVRPFLSWIF